MIVGSGMLARTFKAAYAHREDVCIYAAGVSNSGCTDRREFSRERLRLEKAIKQAMDVSAFVYFGTCSIADPEAQDTPYVKHKLAMEQLVAAHSHYLILRLPQVAGITPNPHTLLNYLYVRIVRSERFSLWCRAKRNIIDVDDVASIAQHLIANQSQRNMTINIANAFNYPMEEIIKTLGQVVGKNPLYDSVDRGSNYLIDINDISPFLDKANVKFDNTYLERVLKKYYQKRL